MTRIALYPGSFDPLTNGHLDIISRACRLADRLVIAVGAHHEKSAFLSAEKRKALIAAEIANIADNIDVAVFDGLVVDAARDLGASLLVRGLRNGSDFDYEMQMAGMNQAMAPDVETVFLAAAPSINYLSSSLVRQIAAMGGDISSFVPAQIAEAVRDRIGRAG
ncbi:MAG: pantetheine-phosphate adenylyltransferase [Hyphomicrobiales bacterium]|nr:MAG: pantetheine-phosphate adenylyltransferase [Hyphomicrobiales bacterium]